VEERAWGGKRWSGKGGEGRGEGGGGRDENTNKGGKGGKNETEGMEGGMRERRRPKSLMRGAGTAGEGEEKRVKGGEDR